MRIVDVTDLIKDKLQKSGLSKDMISLEYCDFLIIEERDDKIIGAGGLGGILNVPSLQIHENHRGEKIGKKLLDATIEETKKRGYSFISGSRNPENSVAIKLHDFYGFKRIFRMHYSPGIVRDVIILVLTPKGKIIEQFFSIFNTLIGTIIFSIFVKITKPLFSKLFTLSPDEFPDISISHMIKNFEKLKD
jgi:GNAT superfamily N-acetyltransferase